MEYRITLDMQKRSVFDNTLAIIEAKSPKEVAEQYAGEPLDRHVGNRGGDIVVETVSYPHRSFIYSRRPARADQQPNA